MKNNRNLSVLNVLILIYFSISMFTKMYAQESWNSPQIGEGPFVNSNLLLDYNSDNSQRDSWHQVYWFEEAIDQYQTARFFKRSQRINGDCVSSGRIIFNWNETSPCYNSKNVFDLETGTKLNFAQVRVRRGNPLCFRFDMIYGAPVTFPVKIPVFAPPLPQLGEYFTCPDGSVEITVNVLRDALFQETPNLVQWFRINPATGSRTEIFADNNVASTLTSTLKTNIGTNPIDVQFFEVVASKNYNGCVIEGESALIPVTSAIGAPLLPPTPQIISNCNAENTTVIIPNDFGYDGVFWYKNLIDPNGPTESIHDGFSYNYTQDAGFDQLYVEYYKQLESGCYIRSPRVPITFVSSPELRDASLRTNNQIFDFRDFNEVNCEVERTAGEQITTPYYYDLPNPSGLNITDELINDFSNTLGFDCNEFTIQSTEAEWVPVRASDPSVFPHFKESTNVLGQKVFRVCADNISAVQGEYGFKDFQLQINIRGKITLCGGDPDNSAVIDCSVPVRGNIIRVITREPGTITDNCNFPTADIFNILVNPNANCNRSEFETVCKDNQPVTLGPSNAELTAFFTSQGILGFDIDDLNYSWTPSSGLSNSTIANPTVNFNSIPTNVGQIQSYTLTVTYNGALPPLFGRPTYTFCSYVYKCSSCGRTGVVDGLLGLGG